MNDIPVKYKDDKMDIRKQWQLFGLKLKSNLFQMETEAQSKIAKSRNFGNSFEERKKLLYKLSWCKQQREKINTRKIFALEEMDYEIINERGFENWFRNYDGYLFQ